MFGAKNQDHPMINGPAYVPSMRNKSETYANALAHMEGMEQQLADLTKQYGAMERVASLAESERDQCQAENARLREQNERLKALFVRLDDRINTHATVLLGARDLITEMLGAPPVTPASQAVNLENIASAIEGAEK